MKAKTFRADAGRAARWGKRRVCAGRAIQLRQGSTVRRISRLTNGLRSKATETPPNSIVNGQIKAAVDTELAKKGLTRTDSDGADLYIGYQTGISTEKQYTSFDSGWGYGPGW